MPRAAPEPNTDPDQVGEQRTRSAPAGVLAIVLTFNAPDALARCLRAIREQRTAPAAILVVDNASDADLTGLVESTPSATLRRLPENLGPAGGYAAGLSAFLATDYAWAWVMDDDCTAAPDALEAQLEDTAGEPVVMMATMIDRDTGEETNTHGWCAVLIPRAAVEKVGVPRADLFWWTEDTEYLQWRMPVAAIRLERSTRAKVTVSRGRADAAKPAWKYYYEARNQVYYRLHTQHATITPVPSYLRLRVRVLRAVESVTKLGLRAVTREHEQRARKLAMVVRGTGDGIWGRLGRTVAVDDSDRPL